MSAGMNVAAAWPTWRGPDAYGHATATRILTMGRGATRGAHIKDSRAGPPAIAREFRPLPLSRGNATRSREARHGPSEDPPSRDQWATGPPSPAPGASPGARAPG